MEISMEIPVKHLEEISELTDFDFTLTHLILNGGRNSEYVKFYRYQAAHGRTVWVDNSIHELKTSLSKEEILTAAEMVDATHIVAPEVLNDANATVALILETKELIAKLNLPFKLIGSWNGYWNNLVLLSQICDRVALPFDRPRQNLGNEEVLKCHYFGYRSLDELRRKPPRSIDTSMPIRAGIRHIHLDERERRPNLGYLDYNLEITKEQMKVVKANIQLMKIAGMPVQKKA